MSIVVTGANGQLGYDVVRELKTRNYDNVFSLTRKDLDISNKLEIKKILKKLKPKIIIHCAAYTDVDNAEENEELCMKVNFLGTKYLLNEAKRYQAKFLFISSDYVFNGKKETPYEIDDLPDPSSVYGKSKHLGEIETRKYYKHFILRVSWLFGKNGKNFVKTMLKLGNEKNSLRIVDDQRGSPTYTLDLSKLIVDMIETKKYGTYHASNEGECSWYEFSKEIFNQAKIKIELEPVLSSDYYTKAKRPTNSLISKSELDNKGFSRLPHWKNALKRFLEERMNL